MAFFQRNLTFLLVSKNKISTFKNIFTNVLNVHDYIASMSIQGRKSQFHIFLGFKNEIMNHEVLISKTQLQFMKEGKLENSKPNFNNTASG